MSLNWNAQEKVEAKCKDLRKQRGGRDSVSDRQERIEGWDQEKVEKTTILLQGCGGINSVIGQGLVRQGYGEIHAIDPDTVSASNLARQFYKEEDIFQVKGPAFAHRLAEAGFLGSRIFGHGLYFSEFVEQYQEVSPDAVISGVDHNPARTEAVQYSLERDIPLICVGVARDGSGAYVFVQEAGGEAPCLGCYLGQDLTGNGVKPCPGTPAVLDVLQAVGGFALYGLSSLIMDRQRTWNLAKLFMATAGIQSLEIVKDPLCPLCSKAENRLGGNNGT